MHRTEPAEDPLYGGTANQGLVFRVGNTVRRPIRTTSASTHALLRHLADVGFDGAPRFLGIDHQGREVLSYMPGEAVTPPYPAWALTDKALDSVAELLHAYHDAVSTFDPAGYTWPRAVPAHFRAGIVSHNDPNLDNVVFRDRRAVALIDFDLAGPGSVVWDVAAAARLWAPLRLDCDIADARRGRALDRLRPLCRRVRPRRRRPRTRFLRRYWATTTGATTSSGKVPEPATPGSPRTGGRQRNAHIAPVSGTCAAWMCCGQPY